MQSTASRPASNGRIDVNEIAATLRLFVPPGEIGEIRAFKDRIPKGGFYFDHTEIEQAAALAVKMNKTAGVFLILNRIKPDDPDLNQRPRLRIIFELTKDENIVRRLWLLIDFDPTSPERGAEDSSTDAEKEVARQRMNDCYDWLRDRYWPEPIVADSGNGWHLLFRIDLPNDDESHRLIREFLNALSKR